MVALIFQRSTFIKNSRARSKREKRRVVIVTDSLHPWNFGGKEERIRSLQNTSLLQGDSEFEIIYATMKWWEGDDPANHIAISPLRPMYKGSKRSIRTSLLFALNAFRVIKLKPEIIEADQIPILPIFVLKIVSLITRAPLSVTWHEVWEVNYWREYLGRFGWLAANLEKLAMRLPDQIIAVSVPTRFKLIRAGVPESKIELIHNDVDMAGIRNAVTKLPKSDLLFAGRLIENKRLHIALRAVSLLKEQGVMVTLALVGDGPELEYLKQLAKELGISRLVTFHGFLENNSDVWGLMKKCPIFISPSTREGFGFSVAEAHVAGARIIMADHPENAAHYYLADKERVTCIEGDDPRNYATALLEKLKEANFTPIHTVEDELSLFGKYASTWTSLLNGRMGA